MSWKFRFRPRSKAARKRKKKKLLKRSVSYYGDDKKTGLAEC